MSDTPAAQPYRVLARKYRPADFAGLIGQSALVRTLTNAIQTGRLAHAFVLTGVRGVGKTTTARIIARALNCIGVDGKGGPTTAPCGVCENCRAIAEDRHVDVSEMDAASRTGIDGIRELIDSVRYRPTSARFKIYIIDEIHMLSVAAFNALLKTLEEPPEHVKFIFATTEVRKIPVTVLSRCQRFDLRRVDSGLLEEHFTWIADQEKVTINPEAMSMICRAADGSVRDGLSLLDQAISHGAGTVTAEQVRDMLGLADRARVFDLYDRLMHGDIKAALEELNDQYASGADPTIVLEDMLELTHWLTRMKIVPDDVSGANLAENERVRGVAMAADLSVASLTRCWQMLLKGLAETKVATSPLQAAEMVLIRLSYVVDQPTPGELVEILKQGKDGRSLPREKIPPPPLSQRGETINAPLSQREEKKEEKAVTKEMVIPATFEELVDFLFEKREPVIATALKNLVHLIHYEIGKIDLRLTEDAPADLARQISDCLSKLTNSRWLIGTSREEGKPTLREQSVEKDMAIQNHPLVQSVLSTFPGARIKAVRKLNDSLAIDQQQSDWEPVIEDE